MATGPSNLRSCTQPAEALGRFRLVTSTRMEYRIWRPLTSPASVCSLAMETGHLDWPGTTLHPLRMVERVRLLWLTSTEMAMTTWPLWTFRICLLSPVPQFLLGKGDGDFIGVKDYWVEDPCASGFFLTVTSVAIADVNGDHKPDVITTNNCELPPNLMGVLLNNGDGTFQPVKTLTVANNGPMAVADLNRDGDPDVIVADYFSNTVEVLLGNGDDTFQSGVSYNANGPTSIKIADFNHDGKLDLVTTNYFTNTLDILLGNGDGSFQLPISSSTALHPLATAVADFNHDGKTDVAVINWDGQSTSVFLGKGDGTFQPRVQYSVGKHPFD